jgi:hypothetical protein
MSRISAFLVALGVIVLFIFGLVFGLFLPSLVKTSSPPAILNTSAILQQVQTLSQWVTVKYVLEKVIVLEDVKWYGENRVTLIAHGVVKAGINLQGLKAGDIKINGPKISLRLPSPGITDVYLDDHRTQVLDWNKGLLRAYDKDLEQQARAQAVSQLRDAALINGIIRESNERAQSQLMNLLHQLGFKEVEFEGKAAGK